MIAVVVLWGGCRMLGLAGGPEGDPGPLDAGPGELSTHLTLNGEGTTPEAPYDPLAHPEEEDDGSKPSTEAERRWRFDFATYIWFATVSGSMSMGNLNAEANSNFGDVFGHLSGAFTVHFEGFHDNRIGIISDFAWMQFRSTHTFDTDVTTVEGSSRLGMRYLEFAVAGRVAEETINLDFFGGFRGIFMHTQLDLDPLGEADKTRILFDPMFGVRVIWEPVSFLMFTLRTDVSGYGVGNALMGNVAGFVGFRFTPMFALLVGYRAIGLNFIDTHQDIEVRMMGPEVAFDVGF